MRHGLIVFALFALGVNAALAQQPPQPKSGAAGCSGPVMELIPGMSMCDLDPGKTVRFLCTNGKTIDVPMVNGDVKAPSCG